MRVVFFFCSEEIFGSARRKKNSLKHSVSFKFEKKTFRSRGYDATTHFESTVDDVLEMYTRITGKVIDLDAVDPDKAAGDDE